MKNNKAKVLKMDDELFKFRRQIIGLLYEARTVLGMELPRIKVRIVEYTDSTTLGTCWIDKDYITLAAKLSQESENTLRAVVWHELAHAYFKAPHVEGCPLMDATLDRSVTKAQLVKALKALKPRKTKSKAYANLWEAMMQ